MLYYSREKLDSREKQDMDDIDNEESTPYFPSFRIWLCGTFRVERRLGNGYEPVRTTEWGGSSYPRLLLKALLCCPGRQARRDALLDMLWPDAELEHAVQNLNTAVTRLRKVLAPSKGEASLLLTDEDSHVYRLEMQSLLWVDTDAALTRLGEAERYGRTSREALSLLEETETYLSKGMILQDEEGQWAAGRRATVEQARYRTRLWLADAYEQQQMPGQAEMILSQIFEEDPTDEDVLARSMVLLHRHGMTHKALRYYNEFIEVAGREGLEPTEGVRVLAERLRSEKRRLSTPVHNVKRHSIDWGVAPSPDQFYGRSKELSVLKSWVEDEHCRLVAIFGLGGIGKTRHSIVLATQMKDTFEYVFWRSLHHAPPSQHILQEGIKFFSDQQQTAFPDNLHDQISLTPSRFVCKEGQSRNKQGEKTGPPSQEALAEQKEAAEICKSHQGKRPLRSSCYTGPSANHISLQTTHSGWLLVCQQPSVFSCYETGILGKWMSCMTAQAMVRQLVSVVNASI